MSQKPTRETLPSFLADARAEAENWLGEHRDVLPPAVADALILSLRLAAKLSSKEESHRAVVAQLRRALGIIPSSERRKNSQDVLAGAAAAGEAKGRAAKKDLLIRELDKSQRLAKRYRSLANRHGRTAKNLEGRIMEIDGNDDELSPEDQAELDRVHEEYLVRLAQGERCDLDCAAAAETLMTGCAAQVKAETVCCDVDRDSLPRGSTIKQRFVEERERISFSLTITRLDLEVEKLAVETPRGMTLLAGTTEDIGPPKTKVTWEFLASMTIMVAQYAMPMNRFAALVTTPLKRFTGGEMSRYFRYVAERLCPVYLELGRGLANSAVVSGDDTTSRVIEVQKALAARAAGDSGVVVPWEGYATEEIAAKSLGGGAKATLALRLGAALGFEFDRKDGKGSKKGFNTTMVSGRLDASDPRSTIVFFRSHLGGLGNLLTKILAGRAVDRPDLVIQSDLSTVNLISDPTLAQRLKIKHAGCASHARRPFAQYEDDDPEPCSWILNHFQGIAIFERSIELSGRNRDNTAAVRDVDEREAWEGIKRAAGILARKWSRETELGEGARYIIRHFDKLTYYLTDHRVSPNNNFSERMLRLEKLIENNALFRQKLEGRFALDIVRSVLQTGIAAKINLDEYLNWLLRLPAELIEAAPAEFTPLAFAHLHSRLQ